jgi:hypothetical protein
VDRYESGGKLVRQINEERSLGDLFGDLTREMGTLVRQEVELAKTEMTQKASQAGKNIGSMVAGGAVAYAGFLAILAGIIIGISSLGVPWWLSALLVGLVVTGVGYFMIQKGREALKQESLAPRQTINTLKEDAEWAKEQVK